MPDAPHTSQPPSGYQAAADLRAALRRLTVVTDQTTKRHGLTPRRYELLLFVQAANDAGRPPTVTSLCEPLQTSQGSVTQLVHGTVRAGLLERKATPNDKRSHQLQLSAEGARRLKAAFHDLARERERLTEIARRFESP